VKRTRGLWISIVFMLILAIASVTGFVTGVLSPTLGLDLQGGVAVILSAPEGTPPDVMEQALENIRRRVDAFGVGEPDIFLSGETIEVQIPGASDSEIEQRDADLYCVGGPEGVVYGCSTTEEDVQAAVDGLETTSQVSEACVVTAEGDEVDCYPSKAEADAAIAAFTVSAEKTPTPTPTPTGSVSASPSSGPVLPADSYCLTDPTGAQPLCFDTAAEADDAKEGLETQVTERVWCLTPTLPEPSPSPEPTPDASETPTGSSSAAASAPASPSPAASPSPSGIEAFQKLDFTDAERLPCDFETEEDAQEALGSVEVTHVTVQFCVVSSAGEDLGCFRERKAAVTRQRETGQQRLLAVIGTTARLEERPTLDIIAQGDPRWQSVPVTCGSLQEQGTPRCTGRALDGEEVVYIDPSDGSKVRLGPVVVTGENIERAFAEFSGGGTPQDPIREWLVNFDFDSEGAKAFGDATTRMFALPTPQNQLAIVVDRQIVSNPRVNEPITGGTGTISGTFTEQQAKDLATLLNAGSLPVELTQESVRTVSPTLGDESLQQGIAAAIAGLVLLLFYLLLYYRMLGIVAWLGMAIWAVLALAIVSVAGREFGYALTLAGVAGLVISLGVTADSYIVFFERLKDELRSGKSARAVIQPAFKRAFRTIVAADIVTGIAALVLYLTAASSVRGFALTLGVATALDLFVVWFFKRPTVFLLSRNRRLAEMKGFGLRAAAAADHLALDTSGEGA